MKIWGIAEGEVGRMNKGRNGLMVKRRNRLVDGWMDGETVRGIGKGMVEGMDGRKVERRNRWIAYGWIGVRDAQESIPGEACIISKLL